MDTYTINKELDRLYAELEEVATTSFKSVCKKYNSESKSEVIAAILSEINTLEDELSEMDDYCEDDDMDYRNLQMSQGLAVARW